MIGCVAQQLAKLVAQALVRFIAADMRFASSAITRSQRRPGRMSSRLAKSSEVMIRC